MGDQYSDTVEALTKLSNLLELRIAREGTGDDLRSREIEVWRIYAQTERLVAIFKSRLGVETPGMTIALPKSQPSVEILRSALEHLRSATRSLESGRTMDSLNELRSARNRLREFLSGERRNANRAKRTRSTTSSC